MQTPNSRHHNPMVSLTMGDSFIFFSSQNKQYSRFNLFLDSNYTGFREKVKSDHPAYTKTVNVVGSAQIYVLLLLLVSLVECLSSARILCGNTDRVNFCKAAFVLSKLQSGALGVLR